MRVVVNIPPGSHPELLRELELTPPRERAERLRMLATIGLLNMSQPSKPLTRPAEPVQSDEDNTSTVSPAANQQDERKQSLKSKLGLGL